jgi:putative membrane protein
MITSQIAEGLQLFENPRIARFDYRLNCGGHMVHYWNDLYFGWGWVFWFGLIVLLFLSVGSWGYTYRVHRIYEGPLQQKALDILNERYARGEITRDQFIQMKSDIMSEMK